MNCMLQLLQRMPADTACMKEGILKQRPVACCWAKTEAGKWEAL